MSATPSEDVRRAAELAVLAFDTDDIQTWISGRQACENPPNTALSKLLKTLRKAWWHDGLNKDREAVHIAATCLRFRLLWEEERAQVKRRAT